MGRLARRQAFTVAWSMVSRVGGWPMWCEVGGLGVYGSSFVARRAARAAGAGKSGRSNSGRSGRSNSAIGIRGFARRGPHRPPGSGRPGRRGPGGRARSQSHSDTLPARPLSLTTRFPGFAHAVAVSAVRAWVRASVLAFTLNSRRDGAICDVIVILIALPDAELDPG